MFHVLLYRPEIPPNTGNIIRLCANTGARLHLIGPLGFRLDQAALRRAGMDYAELMDVQVHADWAACRAALGPRRIFALTTRSAQPFHAQRYAAGDAFLFGPESSGLPLDELDGVDAAQRLTLPMRPGCRSMNLSNAVAVVVYEAWRQCGFAQEAAACKG